MLPCRSSSVDDLIDGLGKSFEAEFDFSKEAQYLRTCASNLPPSMRTRVTIPLPIDGAHPSAPLGKSLCTKRVLTMERVAGEPIKRRLRRAYEAYARRQGMSFTELQAQLSEQARADPERFARMASAKPFSEALTTAYAGVLSMLGMEPPLNGPAIVRLLCRVHARQIFVDGVFNSDPHAGNVLVEADGKLGLVDYGACAELTHAQRRALARLIVAICDGDDDGVLDACSDFGFTSVKMDRVYMLAYAQICFHRGYNMADMRRVGVPSDVGMAQLDLWLAKRDTLERFEGSVAQVQRCIFVLLGLAQELGAGGVSIARMWRPHAKRYLASHPE